VSIEKGEGEHLDNESTGASASGSGQHPFWAEYERLQREHHERAENAGCVECSGCVGCVDCVFCRDCVRCYRSRYSVGCSESLLLTHCESCRECRSLAYCQRCEHCADSNYLVACSYCYECDYCFGCVGLVKKDFHILNKKYSRSDYFREVARLRKELALAAPAD
jgi:hypothetical protein